MVVHRGFSIIELLVYSTVSICLVVIVMQFLSSFQRSMLARSGVSLYLASVYAGMDSMVRDCASAPADPQLWITEQSDSIVWHDKQGVLGFLFEHDALLRISRSPDTDGRLKAPVRSTLMNNVQGYFVVSKSKDYMSTITVFLTAQCHDTSYSMNKRVYLLNGVVS